MAKSLPRAGQVEALARGDSLFRLRTRSSNRNLKPPTVALGPQADYVVDYYKKEFPPREDRPWIAYFDRPMLYGRHFSIIDSQRRLYEECFIRDRRWRGAAPKRRAELAEARKISGTYLLAGNEFHSNYAHFFYDILPRLMSFEEAGLLSSHSLILPPSNPFAAAAYERMGLAGNGSLVWDNTLWQLDGLYYASSVKQLGCCTPEVSAWVRKKLSPGLEAKPPGKKLFYISRRKGTRAVANEGELLDRLRKWNVTVVEPDQLSLPQQIELFSEAGLIIGAQGAGMLNALWAPRGCAVLELINPLFFSGVYWTLAESLDHPYGLVTCSPPDGPKPYEEPAGCELDSVCRAVDALLTARAATAERG
jgi:capsular polysaccharide biosynthesis protein